MKHSITAALLITIASATTALAAGPAKVLLVPFDSVGPAEKEWVAKALQQNLLAELNRVNSVQPVTAEKPIAAMDAAIKAGQDASADYVVFGSYQAVDGDLRLTGQVVDVSKKQTVVGLKTTGSLRDLFGLEDVIASQVKRALPQPVAQAQPEMLKQPVAQPAAEVQPTGPVVMDPAQRARELEAELDRAIERLRYVNDSADDYYPPNYYGSGYYSPYYPYYSFPVVIVNNRHRFHHHAGTSIHGSFNGGHFSGGFRAGGTTVQHISSAPANYASFGRMSIAPRR